MARPRKKLDEIKLFQINLRVTLNEQVQLEEIAKANGLNLVEYIRRRALQKQLPKFTMSGLQRDLLIELSRIGNNINQMSKRVNQGNPNLKGLESELSNLHKQLNEIKNQLLA
ncbi:plasmid mobilization protein [Flavobacterium cyclinae]|uniref:plasmid mobilization protein n=1 Tax=Flavobacterium cyclinae TaxID=2895947 RepID=UPI001E5AE16E|nr:plasmid mobilization relaxosome protein MobC [Flavobacterium cyclinae]UGS21824.1 MobC family plasmid mobilization relaxosome protein [Flavobacterium cyclinae]